MDIILSHKAIVQNEILGLMARADRIAIEYGITEKEAIYTVNDEFLTNRIIEACNNIKEID